MRFLQNYLRSLLACCSNPGYYFVILKQSMWASFSFFLLTLGFVSFVTVAGWRFYVWPDFLHFLETESAQLISQLPPQSQFRLEKGLLTTNQIALPFELTSSPTLEELGLPHSLITLNVEEKAAPSAITLAPTSLFFESTSDQPDRFFYKDIFEGEIIEANPERMRSFISTQLQFLKEKDLLITAGFGIFTYLGSLFLGLLFVLFFSFIIQSFAWLIGIRLRYAQTFQLGLHLYPIAFGIDQVSLFLSPKSHFPLVNLTYILMSALILWHAYSQKNAVKLPSDKT